MCKYNISIGVCQCTHVCVFTQESVRECMRMDVSWSLDMSTRVRVHEVLPCVLPGVSVFWLRSMFTAHGVFSVCVLAQTGCAEVVSELGEMKGRRGWVGSQAHIQVTGCLLTGI